MSKSNFLKIPISLNLAFSVLLAGIAFIQNETPINSPQLASIKHRASYDMQERLGPISMHPLSESIENELLDIFSGEPNGDDDHGDHGGHNHDDDHGDDHGGDHYRV